MESSTIGTLNGDDLFHMFVFLHPNDLFAFALTCQEMKGNIYKFCETKKLKNHEFFERTHYLSPKEIKLKNQLTTFESPLLSYKLAKLYNDRVRISCADVDFFPHSSNPSYFSKEQDTLLEHDVLRLTSVCWLEIKHTFKNVNPGRYKYLMRMKFGENFRWPSYFGDNQLVKFRTSWKNNKDSPPCENEVRFKSGDWANIKKYLDDGEVFDGFPVGCSFQNHDKASGWFDLVMDEPIVLKSNTNEVFSQFLDIENGSWKSGIIWDYIELNPFYAGHEEESTGIKKQFKWMKSTIKKFKMW